MCAFFTQKTSLQLNTQTINELMSSLSLMETIFQHSSEAIIITDAQNNIVHVNKAFTQLTGYEEAEVLGKNPHIFSAGKTSAETYQQLWTDLLNKGHWQGELLDKHKDGSEYPKHTKIKVIYDQQGEIKNYVACFYSLSQQKAVEQKILYLTEFDTLTSLPNRASLQKYLAQAVLTAQHTHEKLAVLLLDLDKFKNINDTAGPEVGDLLLTQVAYRLKSCLSEHHMLARVGGDEFVIILSGLEQSDAIFPWLEKILSVLRKPYVIDVQQLEISPSIGIAVFPHDGLSVDELMKNADIAMYHAKQRGRNNFQFFDAEVSKQTAELMDLEQDMRQGIKLGQFFLHFQPKVSARTGRVEGVEALLRWQHPHKGWISPAQFIPVAESSGFIGELGDWVLRQACQQLKRFAQQGMTDIHIAVNLSARQFTQQCLVQTLEQLLKSEQLNPALLELEITESMTMADPHNAILTMQQLREIGHRLSIDDFGTGYSSLSYLKKFPVSSLKIDRSFVKDIETDHNDAAICTATIALAHSMGLEVVAEGVESEMQLNYLKRLGCNLIQGFYYSKALPPDDIVRYIAERNTSSDALSSPCKHVKILVIDDDALMCDFLKQVLDFVGHQTATFTDPQIALQTLLAQPNEFDIIIVDLVMPGMSGVDLISAIRQANQNIPLVIASGMKQAETRKAFFALEQTLNLMPSQNYFVLEKPFSPEDVLHMVRQAINSAC